MTVELTLNGLAKFIEANAIDQRKLLRDYKFPDPEGKAQAGYYRDAQRAIHSHHNNPTASVLSREASKLINQLSTAPTHVATRLRHNVRAIEAYATHFADRQFELSAAPRLRLRFGDVSIRVTPDLYVVERGKPRLIKIHFAAAVLSDKAIRVLSQGLFEAAHAAGHRLPSSAFEIFDLASGETARGARMGARMKAELEAACLNISSMWPSIAPPPARRRA